MVVMIVLLVSLIAIEGEAGVFEFPQWQIREFHAPDALGHEEVRDILLARDGAVWFATMGGGVTCRKDGISTVYDKDKGLISNLVDCLQEDRSGGIWVGTREGISYIYQDVITNFSSKTEPQIPDDLIDTIAVNARGEIWFGTGNTNLFHFTPQAIVDRRPVGVWANAVHAVNAGPCRKILFDSDDTLWAAIMGYGLCRVVKNDPSQTEPWGIEVIPCENHWETSCYDMFLAESRAIWVGGGDCSFSLFQNGKLIRSFLSLFKISTLGEYDNQKVLVGTFSEGLFSFDLETEQWSPIVLSPLHPTPYIECIQRSPDGTFWIGTREGAYRISRSPWQSIPSRPGGVKFRSGTLLLAEDGYPYAVDEYEDLYRYDNSVWTKVVSLPVQEKYAPGAPVIHCLISDAKGKFYYLCNRYSETNQVCLLEIQLPAEIAIRELPLPDDFVVMDDTNRLFITSNGDLWVTYQEGVSRWDGAHWTKWPTCKEREKKNVYSLLEPMPDVFWIVGRKWAERWNQGEGQPISLPTSYADYADVWSKIYSVIQHDDAYWFATDQQGILKWDGQQWSHFHHKDGLPSEGIHCLYSAKDGTLWVGSERMGVSSLKEGRWITYGMADGIPPGQVVNILEDNAGTIWLDLEYEGFANYQPTSDAPLVWIESGSKNMIPGERGIFTCDGHDYLNVTRKEDLVYSWRVVDDTQHTVLQDWSPYSLQKTIMTPRMLPGRYQLQVRSQDKDRNTSRVSASLGFTVAPYFWTTPHFLIPVGVSLLIAALSLGIWYRKHRALQVSENKYRTLVEKDSLTLLANWDSKGRIVYCNECAERLFGLPTHRMVGAPAEQWLTHRNTDSIAMFRETVKRALAQPDVPQECRLCTRVGDREVWISWFVRAVMFVRTRNVEYHAVGVDITQQVKTEKALMQEKMSFREFCDSVQIGMIQLNLEGKIEYMNPAMQRIAGLSGPNISEEIAWCNPVTFQHFCERIQHSNKPISQLMEGHRAGCDSRFFVFVSGMFKDNRVEIMALDFTEQKMLEQKLAMASSHEQERLGREMHDGLGQHLTALTYLVSFLERKSQKMSKDIFSLVQELNASLRFSLQQTRDLSRSLYPVALDRIGLQAALKELIQSFANTYPTPIALQWDEEAVTIERAHYINVYRIIREACFNALKHAKASRIVISSRNTGSEMSIRISDDGIGIGDISSDHLSQGMGLSIMEYHAKLIGGVLSIEQNPSGGTDVICRIGG